MSCCWAKCSDPLRQNGTQTVGTLLDNGSHYPEAWKVTTTNADPHATPVVSFHDLEVSYGRNTILHDISARVCPGSCVAITGNNGSGKSTLVKALVGITPFQRGSIDLLGYKRRADAPPQGPPPWGHVGYVPQRLTATGGIDASVTEVVQAGLLGLGDSAWSRLRPPRDWRSRVDAALDRVGLAHRAMDRFSILSGGQQQRCLIARALVRNPELIILDEPLAGLDAHNRQRLAEITASHLDEGKTAMIVLHELAELRPLITRELRIAGGHIVHNGPCTHESHFDPTGPWSDTQCSDHAHTDSREASHA